VQPEHEPEREPAGSESSESKKLLDVRIPSKKATYRAALVVWLDSFRVDGWVFSPDIKPGKIWSLGWVLKDREKYIVLSCSVGLAKGEKDQYNSPISIPKSCVISIQYFDDALCSLCEPELRRCKTE